MRTVAVLLCLLCLPGGAQPEIVTSEVHALYYMLECLIDEPHRSPEMADTLRGRVGNWYPVEQALKGWRRSWESAELATLRFPPVLGRTPDLSAVLEKVALSSSSVPDFVERVRPWLGPDHSLALEKALLELEPVFRRLYWEGSQRQFLERRREVESALAAGDFEGSLARASAFFAAELPPGEPLRLALIPHIRAPGVGRTHTRGHSSGTLQVMEIVVDKPNSGTAGTVFHEFVHALWAAQDEAEATRWRERFQGHGAGGAAAYVQLNEALATAIGNGWFTRRLRGELEPGTWYADPVIDAYGRVLLPVVQQALEEGRRPTEAELDAMVEAFRTALPEALDTFDVVAADFTVVSARPEVHTGAFQNEVMRLGPVRSSRVRSWDEAGTPSSFTVYWVSAGDRDRLHALGWPAEPWERFVLRRGERGWELAFEGDAPALFELLRQFQRTGLAPSNP